MSTRILLLLTASPAAMTASLATLQVWLFFGSNTMPLCLFAALTPDFAALQTLPLCVFAASSFAHGARPHASGLVARA